MWLSQSAAVGIRAFLIVMGLVGFLMVICSFTRNRNRYGFTEVVTAAVVRAGDGGDRNTDWYVEVPWGDEDTVRMAVSGTQMRYARLHVDGAAVLLFKPGRRPEFWFQEELETQVHRERLSGIGVVLVAAVLWIFVSKVKLGDDRIYVSDAGFDS